MKFNPWIFPGLAALAIGTWACLQIRTADALEADTTRLTTRIRQVRTIADEQPKNVRAKDVARQSPAKKIDWKTLAAKISAMQHNSAPDMRAMMHAQRLLVEMSAADLAAQLDEIAGLDLDDAERAQLEGIVINVLADKDPKLVLDHYADQIGTDSNGIKSQLQLPMAFAKWAGNDPTAAAAWFDEQIKQGKFDSKSLDGKNPARLSFERVMVNTLLQSDPQAASARVAALPEEQRQDLLQQNLITGLVKPGSEVAYANLVRANLPADKAAQTLANTASTLVFQGGYERVNDFISKAQVTEEEKSAIVSQVIGNQMSVGGGSQINKDTLDKARAWAATQSPGSVDYATGQALAISTARGADFEQASTLALQYQESSGKDDVLAAFITAGSRPDLTKTLIDKIKDTALRVRILNLPQYKQSQPDQ